MGGVKNYTGEKFGKLTVIRKVIRDGVRYSYWECLCDCGNTKIVSGDNLLRTASCGCLAKENRIHRNVVGYRFGKLVVIKEVGTIRGNNSSYRMVLCQCDCGKTILKRLTSLFYKSDRSGRSCGCAVGDAIRDRVKRHDEYGLRKHQLYRVWKGMRGRCYNKNNPRYNRYGGRGIKICKEWYNSFIPFYEWSLNNGWEKGLTIDRIDNDKGYSPNNCRWVTMLVQANNTSRTTYVMYMGNKVSLSVLCKRLNLRTGLIRQRIKRDGLTFEEAINKSIKK